jgi:hypothetical protein
MKGLVLKVMKFLKERRHGLSLRENRQKSKGILSL